MEAKIEALAADMFKVACKFWIERGYSYLDGDVWETAHPSTREFWVVEARLAWDRVMSERF